MHERYTLDKTTALHSHLKQISLETTFRWRQDNVQSVENSNNQQTSQLTVINVQVKIGESTMFKAFEKAIVDRQTGRWISSQGDTNDKRSKSD